MNALVRFFLTLPVFCALALVTGCYTQLGTVRSDEDPEDLYESEESTAYADSASESDDLEEEYEEYEERGRYYPFPYYYYPPVYGGAWWYDPWYWGAPYCYDPFWGRPFVAISFWAGYYPSPYSYYYYPYHGYHPGYPVYAYGGGHGSTRTIGTSRGTGERSGGPLLGRDSGRPRVTQTARSGDRSLPPVSVNPRRPAGKGRTTGGENGAGVESGRTTTKPRAATKPSTPAQRPAAAPRDGDQGGSRGSTDVGKSSPPRPGSSSHSPAPSSGGGRSRGGSGRSGPRN